MTAAATSKSLTVMLIRAKKVSIDNKDLNDVEKAALISYVQSQAAPAEDKSKAKSIADYTTAMPTVALFLIALIRGVLAWVSDGGGTNRAVVVVSSCGLGFWLLMIVFYSYADQHVDDPSTEPDIETPISLIEPAPNDLRVRTQALMDEAATSTVDPNFLNALFNQLGAKHYTNDFGETLAAACPMFSQTSRAGVIQAGDNALDLCLQQQLSLIPGLSSLPTLMRQKLQVIFQNYLTNVIGDTLVARQSASDQIKNELRDGIKQKLMSGPVWNDDLADAAQTAAFKIVEDIIVSEISNSAINCLLKQLRGMLNTARIDAAIPPAPPAPPVAVSLGKDEDGDEVMWIPVDTALEWKDGRSLRCWHSFWCCCRGSNAIRSRIHLLSSSGCCDCMTRSLAYYITGLMAAIVTGFTAALASVQSTATK